MKQTATTAAPTAPTTIWNCFNIYYNKVEMKMKNEKKNDVAAEEEEDEEEKINMKTIPENMK